MSSTTAIEILGYAASVLVTVSLMMRSIVRLRWINLVGALAFTAYGLLIRAYPIVLMNLLVVGINLLHLWRMRPAHEAFATVRMRPDDDFVREFLRVHADDIAMSQPAFDDRPDPGRHVLAVLRDMAPAGLLILDEPRDGVARVVLDYVTPAHRDLRVGNHLFRADPGPLHALGVRTVEEPAGDAEHVRYLERLGFTPDGTTWRLDLPPPAPAT